MYVPPLFVPSPPPPADLGEAGPTPDYSYFCCYRFLHALTHPVAAWFYKEETKNMLAFSLKKILHVLYRFIKEKHKEKKAMISKDFFEDQTIFEKKKKEI